MAISINLTYSPLDAGCKVSVVRSSNTFLTDLPSQKNIYYPAATRKLKNGSSVIWFCLFVADCRPFELLIQHSLGAHRRADTSGGSLL
jgi:hypothetical protein